MESLDRAILALKKLNRDIEVIDGLATIDRNDTVVAKYWSGHGEPDPLVRSLQDKTYELREQVKALNNEFGTDSGKYSAWMAYLSDKGIALPGGRK